MSSFYIRHELNKPNPSSQLIERLVKDYPPVLSNYYSKLNKKFSVLPLADAIANHHSALVELLINAMIANEISLDISVIKTKREGAYHNALHHACGYIDEGQESKKIALIVIENMLRQGLSLSTPNSHMDTALSMVCYGSNPDARTPACVAANIELADFLVKNGAVIDEKAEDNLRESGQRELLTRLRETQGLSSFTGTSPARSSTPFSEQQASSTPTPTTDRSASPEAAAAAATSKKTSDKCCLVM